MKIRPTDVITGDVDYIDVKFCADFESATISCIRRLVFALLSKNSTNGNHFSTKSAILGIKAVRFERIGKLSRIWMHHVKGHKKAPLEHPDPNLKKFGFLGGQGQTWQKIDKIGPVGPIFAAFFGTENAIPRQLPDRFI